MNKKTENRPLNYSVWLRSQGPEERPQDTETNLKAPNDSSYTRYLVETTQPERAESSLSSESGWSTETEQNNANASTHPETTETNLSTESGSSTETEQNNDNSSTHSDTENQISKTT